MENLSGRLMVKFFTARAGDTGSTPGQGTKIPHTLWQSQKIFFNFFFFKVVMEVGEHSAIYWVRRELRGEESQVNMTLLGFQHVSGEWS